MSLERTPREQENVVDVARFVTGTVLLSVRDYCVRVTAGAAIGVMLPNVAEAAGKFYAILARAASGANTITIVHFGDSECWTNIVLDAACEGALLYSDGMKWHALSRAPEPVTPAPYSESFPTSFATTERGTQPTTEVTTLATTLGN